MGSHPDIDGLYARAREQFTGTGYLPYRDAHQYRSSECIDETLSWLLDKDQNMRHFFLKACELASMRAAKAWKYEVEQILAQYNAELGRSNKSRACVKNIRRFLTITVNGHEEKACPDSGSSENIMSEYWARIHKLRIRQTARDRRKQFELGNGKLVRAVGRIRADVTITRAAPWSSRPRKRKEWFYVFEKCPVPIILGMPFLESEAILSTNKHFLEACSKSYSDIDSVFWIGSPRNQIRCSINGKRAVATADTGSDINLMSRNYAERNGHWIDKRPEVRRRLQFGDGSEAETIGQVYVNNFRLDWRSPTTPSELAEDDFVLNEKSQHDGNSVTDKSFVQHQVFFHVLPKLPSDIILGRPLLEATDAFSQQGIQLSSSDNTLRRKTNVSCFNLIIEKGWGRWFTNPFKRKERVPTPVNNAGQIAETESSHHDKKFDHRYRVTQMRVEIESLTGLAKRRKLDELATLERNWEMMHRGCALCT